jgi:hypothetical protein
MEHCGAPLDASAAPGDDICLVVSQLWRAEEVLGEFPASHGSQPSVLNKCSCVKASQASIKTGRSSTDYKQSRYFSRVIVQDFKQS